MKTLKALLVVFALTSSFAGMALTENELNGRKPREVKIRIDQNLVSVSILNRELADYRVVIYDEEQNKLYDGELGNEASLGRRFNFSQVEKGTYTLKFINSIGNEFSYQLEVGV